MSLSGSLGGDSGAFMHAGGGGGRGVFTTTGMGSDAQPVRKSSAKELGINAFDISDLNRKNGLMRLGSICLAFLSYVAYISQVNSQLLISSQRVVPCQVSGQFSPTTLC